MSEIFCLAEHRRGKLRDITFEMLGKAKDFSKELTADVSAVLLGYDVENFAKELSSYSNRVLVVKDEKLANFNSVAFQKVLASLILKRKPILTMIGHTAFGMDIAPSLAVEVNLPLMTDCIDLKVKDNKLFGIRRMYNGKVYAEVSFPGADQYMVTVSQGVFPKAEKTVEGEIDIIDSPLQEEITQKKIFIEYEEAKVSEVDITQFDKIVSVGRGIKNEKNLPIVEELSKLIGGVVACSRPVVDAGWLPKDRQVGQSGKTVKPKLYIAVGISGASQHLVGMRGTDTIIAINKDPNAPIFNVADYGIVDDIFKVVPALNTKIKEEKSVI